MLHEPSQEGGITDFNWMGGSTRSSKVRFSIRIFKWFQWYTRPQQHRIGRQFDGASWRILQWCTSKGNLATQREPLVENRRTHKGLKNYHIFANLLSFRAAILDQRFIRRTQYFISPVINHQVLMCMIDMWNMWITELIWLRMRRLIKL